MGGKGGEVIATGRSAARLEELRQSLPGTATVLRNDAASAGDIAELAAVVEERGGLDGLWLNAGFARVGAIEAVTAEAFDEVIGGNLRGPVLQMAALSGLLRDHASVVLTGSTAAYEGSPVASLYAASKGAMLSLVRCWASALGPRNIRVNTLVPGPIDTHFRDFMPPDFRKTFEADVALRLALPRIGTAEETAAVGLFLLSDDAGFVTGSQYLVDGGLVMK